MVDKGRFGESRRVVYLCHLAAFVENVVAYVGHGGDHIHVELAAKTLLDYFHVQQAEEAATETEAQGRRRFG